MASLSELVAAAQEARASDIHLAPGTPARFRVDGRLVDATPAPLTEAEAHDLAEAAIGEQVRSVDEGIEVDRGATIAGQRCRINVYRTSRGVATALRLLASSIPNLPDLGLPPAVMDFPTLNKGIVIVTGETGSGKSTTLAAIVDTINRTQSAHIVTLEDPIEYVYEPNQCSIDQREIGRDTQSFAEGLRASLRQDPDVILVGEMRDLDTIETALTAAETGHLVFGTLHTQSAADSIDRMVDVFPEGRQRQIRLQLSTTLMAVLSQQLLPRRAEPGRVCACEVMIVNPAIRNLIREGKTPQIENTIATSAELGSVTMDNMLVKMARERTVAVDVAIGAAHDPTYVRRQLR